MLNEQQEYILNQAVNWWKFGSNQIFQYTGEAGTGKTFLLFEIIKAIGLSFDSIAFMAYTGQAAIVMRNAGMSTAKTIHSTLYEPIQDYVLDENNEYVLDPYFHKPIMEIKFIPRDLEGVKLFVIDEASMVPEYLAKEINSRNIRIIAIGDLDQLPPVGGNPGYLNDGNIYRLTDIMRQNEKSPILYLAHRALNGQTIEIGTYGNCRVIYEDELTDEEIISADIILCGKNSTREMVNNNFRRNILKTNSTTPLVGEKMICRKNNWFIASDGINLVNGLSGIVTKSPGVEGFDGKTYTIDFQPLMCGGLFQDLKCDYKYLISDLHKRDFLKKSKFSVGEKMEYAYAITTHLSQGSQYNNGIYIEEYLNAMINRNLWYTGVSRFKQSITYVKRRRKFY